jgi:hypothetical protein
MTGYHVTTPKKVERYEASGAILPPVRFWPTAELAWKWARKVKRSIVLKIEVKESYPLPDHKPARWCPWHVFEWEEQ